MSLLVELFEIFLFELRTPFFSVHPAYKIKTESDF